MSPVATRAAAFWGGACPTPKHTVSYTGNYTTSADANPFFELLQHHPENLLAQCHNQIRLFGNLNKGLWCQFTQLWVTPSNKRFHLIAIICTNGMNRLVSHVKG